MVSTAAKVATVSSADKLGFGIFLAVAWHALLILGVGFTVEEETRNAPQLDVTLAHSRSDKSPDDADFLAQHNQEGSGTEAEKKELTNRQQAPFQDPNIRDTGIPQQQAMRTLERFTDTLLTTTGRSAWSVSSEKREARAEREQVGQAESDNPAQDISSLQAKLDQLRQAYAKRPRIHRVTSTATRQADDAYYLVRWEEKIESIGNQNYPEQARRRGLSGKLRMMVSINPDGSVRDSRITQSSGYPLLDESALYIVKLSAPFDPFPRDLREKADVLEIVRTWKFEQNRLFSEVGD